MLASPHRAGQGGSYRLSSAFSPRPSRGHAALDVLPGHVYRSDEVYLLWRRSRSHQSGKHTHGLDRFFSSLVWQAGARAGLLHVILGQYPARALVPDSHRAGRAQTQKKAASKAKADAKKRPPPPPSAVQASQRGARILPKLRGPHRSWLRLTGMLGALWQVIAGWISLTYLVL